MLNIDFIAFISHFAARSSNLDSNVGSNSSDSIFFFRFFAFFAGVIVVVSISEEDAVVSVPVDVAVGVPVVDVLGPVVVPSVET